MALRVLHFHPDPVLRQKAKKVPVVDQSIKKLVDDMIETMQANSGCGLAAPQVGVSLRCIVIGMPEEVPFAIINPEIVKRVGEREVEEGCLSVPGLSAEVTRSVSVIVKGVDCKGKPIRVRGRELLGQALEHEIDHLNGMLFIDRVESPSKLHKKEIPAEVDDLETMTETIGKDPQAN
ncbi:MAG: peptide deformylase [Dehalogenimonas sp.]|uniref:Peptide deformylase n=1 Tax=Candidatus Dehalogenimonas loeffleri TaxID=3127115 RepID=A0ABZ2J7U4_9CHLR|nr:peptide deformylase [Dehalogenimonas sp.]